MNNINHAHLISTLQHTDTYADYGALPLLATTIGLVATGILATSSENFSNFQNYGADLADLSLNAAVITMSARIITICAIIGVANGIFYVPLVGYPKFYRNRLVDQFTQKIQTNTPISTQDVVRTMSLCSYDDNRSLLGRIDPNGLTRNEIINLMDACNDIFFIYLFLDKLRQCPFSPDALIEIMMKYGDRFISEALLKLIDPNTLSQRQWKEVKIIIDKQETDTSIKKLISRLNDDSISYDVAQHLIKPSTFQDLIKKIDVSLLNERQLVEIVVNASSPDSAKAYLEKIGFFNLPTYQIENFLNEINQHRSFADNSSHCSQFIFNLCTSFKILCIIQRVIGIAEVKKTATRNHIPNIEAWDSPVLKIVLLSTRCSTPEELLDKITNDILPLSSTLEEKAWILSTIRMQFEEKSEMQRAVDHCFLLQLGSNGYPNGEVYVGDDTVAVDLLALQKRSLILSKDPFFEDPCSRKQERTALAIAGILRSHTNEALDWFWSDSCPAMLEANQNWKNLKRKVRKAHRQMRDIAIRIDHPPVDHNITNELAAIATELEGRNREPQAIEETLQLPSNSAIKEYLKFISGISLDKSSENLVLIIQGADYFDDTELMPLFEIYLGRNIDALLSQAPEDAPFKVDDDKPTLWGRIKPFLGRHAPREKSYYSLNASLLKDPLKPWVPGYFAYTEQNAARRANSSSAASSSSSGASSSEAAFA